MKKAIKNQFILLWRDVHLLKILMSEVAEYEYEVIGDVYNTSAVAILHKKHLSKVQYSMRHAHVYAWLKDSETLWLAAWHNITGSFRHGSTFQDVFLLILYFFLSHLLCIVCGLHVIDNSCLSLNKQI